MQNSHCLANADVPCYWKQPFTQVWGGQNEPLIEIFARLADSPSPGVIQWYLNSMLGSTERVLTPAIYFRNIRLETQILYNVCTLTLTTRKAWEPRDQPNNYLSRIQNGGSFELRLINSWIYWGRMAWELLHSLVFVIAQQQFFNILVVNLGTVLMDLAISQNHVACRDLPGDVFCIARLWGE